MCIYVSKVLECVVKDVDPYCGPATLFTPSLTTRTSLGVHKLTAKVSVSMYGLAFSIYQFHIALLYVYDNLSSHLSVIILVIHYQYII